MKFVPTFPVAPVTKIVFAIFAFRFAARCLIFCNMKQGDNLIRFRLASIQFFRVYLG